MSFCVECGREGPTIGALCPTCFETHAPIAAIPEFVDITRCAHCGRFFLDGTWSNVDLDRALPGVLRRAIRVTEKADGASIEHSTRPLDPYTHDVTARVDATFGDVAIRRELRAKLRVRTAVCPRCSRERGSYFASILQVRAEGRDLTDREIAAVRAFVEDAVGRARESGEAFLSKVESVRGGIDFYLSSNPLGRTLAAGIRDAFGGTSKTAPKLHTRTAGRDVYRVTYVVRLPRIRPGQIVEFRGERFRVKEIGRLVTLVGPDGGERRFRSSELRRAVPVDAAAQR